MTTHITPLKAWLRAATPAEQDALAAGAGTTRAYLRHLAAGPVGYGREARPALATAIERVAARLRRANPGLPVVSRLDLNASCRQCDYARRCVGEAAATTGEFPVVEGDTAARS